jgi:hypothetical protein
MKTILTLLATLALTTSIAVLANEREAKQAELDAACEAARQAKIKVERARLIEECVETKMLADRKTCENFYFDYGETPAGQPRLYYDLPECEKAHEYRNSYRSSDR